MQSNQIEVLTGGGSAAVAVLRITGPACLAFLQSNFSRQVAAGRCVHGELRDGDEVIDDVVIALDQDNQRAEICTHGSPWIVDRVQRLGAKWGFEIRRNNPQLDPIDEIGTERDALGREVAAWMPVARTELGVRMLGAQLEAWEPILQGKCETNQLAAISNDQTLWRLLHPPTLAIVGRPNAGKSTLANRLFQRDRSIVADLPGTTRDWVGDYADINGLPVLLLDTPGIRATSDAIESEAIRLAENQIATADLIIWLRDGREVRETLPISHGRVLRVRNKCDLPFGPEKEPEEIEISAINGDGLDHLKSATLRTFGCFNLAIPLPRWWTPRQQKWLRQIR